MKPAVIFVATLLFATGCDTEIITPTPSPVKLDYYLEAFLTPGVAFEPETKVEYNYNESGLLQRYTVYRQNPNSGMMEEQRHFSFSYEGNAIKKVEGVNVNATSSHVIYNYSYLPDGRIARITEQNIATQINSEANFNYSEANKTVSVSYEYSNGGSFVYEYVYEGGNLLSDKTTKGSQLCSDGSYTYDQGLNPFRTLGYVDYVLNYVSANNRVSADINYVGCAFPQLVPVAYTYEYNDQGYPTKVTTTYNSGDATSEKRFFYK